MLEQKMLPDTHSVLPISRQKFSVADDYDAMPNAGTFTEDSCIEPIR
ncbi:MAG: hypothetical protein RMK99_17430 [Anaerolineales bacterium]|nr:hypothetical protein [Anaerolineales bacterium]